MTKFLVILLISVFAVCFAQEIESEITKALKSYKVIPDLITEDVPETLKVTFNSGANVDKGNIIYPRQAKDEPIVDWNADKDALYLLVCTDPDAPSPDNPVLAELNTWLVGNIPGNNIQSGDVIAEYLGSAPPRGADWNRYVFLVYKQQDRIEFEEKHIKNNSIEGRSNFSVNEFASKYELGSPVAANFYRSKFDQYVLELYAYLNCCFEYNAPE